MCAMLRPEAFTPGASRVCSNGECRPGYSDLLTRPRAFASTPISKMRSPGLRDPARTRASVVARVFFF